MFNELKTYSNSIVRLFHDFINVSKNKGDVFMLHYKNVLCDKTSHLSLSVVAQLVL